MDDHPRAHTVRLPARWMTHLEHSMSDGDGGNTLRRSLQESVDGAGLAVFLHCVTAAAEEGRQVLTQGLLVLLRQDLPDAGEQVQPGGVGQVRVEVTQLGQRGQVMHGLEYSCDVCLIHFVP